VPATVAVPAMAPRSSAILLAVALMVAVGSRCLRHHGHGHGPAVHAAAHQAGTFDFLRQRPQLARRSIGQKNDSGIPQCFRQGTLVCGAPTAAKAGEVRLLHQAPSGRVPQQLHPLALRVGCCPQENLGTAGPHPSPQRMGGGIAEAAANAAVGASHLQVLVLTPQPQAHEQEPLVLAAPPAATW